jgi:hypothetical protein
LLEQGVTVVEQSAAVGEGSIGRWCINSDSTGFIFADCLAGPADGELAPLRNHPLTKEFLEAGDGTVPLRRAGDFLALVGQAMNEVIASRPNSRVLNRCQAISTRRTATGWLTRIKEADSGRARSIHSRNVVLATGASQPAERLRAETVARANLVERWGEKLLQSSDVLTASGLAAISARLAAFGRSPRVAIIGGSTSAAAVAHALLNRMPGVTFGPNAATIAHRRQLRIFYPSADAALADGYKEFGPDGPVNTRFEQEMLARFFAGEGACTTVCNATIGLMLAIKDAVGDPPPGRFALIVIGTASRYAATTTPNWFMDRSAPRVGEEGRRP